jgi:hypothetical protein
VTLSVDAGYAKTGNRRNAYGECLSRGASAFWRCGRAARRAGRKAGVRRETAVPAPLVRPPNLLALGIGWRCCGLDVPIVQLMGSALFVWMRAA